MKNYNAFKGRSTFTRPPLDQSLPLALLFDYHGTNSPNHPLFRYDEDGELKTILWKDATAAIRRAAGLVSEYVSQNGDDIPVVAVLSNVDSMTYFATIAGIMRAGYQPFPLSTRNSPAAIAHLVQKKNVHHIFVNTDGPMRDLINTAFQDSELTVNIHDMPTFDALYKSNKIVDLPSLEGVTQDSVAVILHSSGSTAFPKPIALTMRLFMESAMSAYYGEIDVGSQVLSAHAVPMFHLMGVIQIAWTAFLGLTVSVFPPTTPPVIPTPDSVFSAAVKTNSSLLYCVPSFVEALARDPEKVKVLSKFLSVLYAGGPLETTTGDMLFKAGVKIVPLYGQTESGTINHLFPSGPDPLGWQWMRISEHVDPVFVPSDVDHLFKLVLKKCPTHTPAILNAFIDGVPVLDTFDLVTRHPQDPRLFQIYGRADDQIMHSTGEKTNPGPIESILVTDPNIDGAIMFGRSKFYAGVIIAPSPDKVFDPQDTEKLAEYRSLIWPTVDKANDFAPAHSRIFKEMILVTHPDKPFQRTPKGSPKRNAVLKDYAEEIEAAYTAFDESSQTQFDPPKSWNAEDCISFIHVAFQSIMKGDSELGDEDDIFQRGCDSLQVTWIRNTVLHALKFNDQVNIREIPQNFVYAYPTARQLGKYMTNLVQGKALEMADTSSRAQQMKSLVNKYTKDFPKRDQIASSVKADTPGAVLITGTTGYLGSHLLARLLESKEFAKVYALNRPSSTTLVSRQEKSFNGRGLDIALLGSPKLVLLEGDSSKPLLGLQNEVHETLRNELTLIIHNAWRVDFNVSLASLEPHLQGTRNLLDLALTSRREIIPRIVFVSSIAVFNNWHSDKPGPEDYLADPAISVSSGYGESKWCGENILREASLQTPLKPVIVRVGQICGGPNGEWNTTEWFPALVRSSQTLKKLPMLGGHLSWVPIDIAAQVITELSHSNYQFANLVHPHPTTASHILDLVAPMIGAEIVPYAQWIEALNKSQSSASDPARNPALKLLEFFQSQVATADNVNGEVLGLPSLSTARTVESSHTLKTLTQRQLGSEDVEKWIGYWRKIGFLDN
ncbi:hypothetical protein D9758_007194 [Tetrapyrgos nigripes]|uniref:Acetyl-CoA synthetase-like protein n=1 Tax=Tetrapyrgos nigripes TaxID=182062 RepID=A0A8H5D0Q1_9AGAR|nr:hypothetical protein D9758_007194 [Tetrapyrgos nigripes]